MANVMTAMITSMCIGLSGNVQEACTKALEAGSKQTGIEHGVELMQKNAEIKADRQAHYLLGDKGMEIAGGGVFLIKTAVDKSVQFALPTFGLCDRIINNVGTDKYSMQMFWGF